MAEESTPSPWPRLLLPSQWVEIKFCLRCPQTYSSCRIPPQLPHQPSFPFWRSRGCTRQAHRGSVPCSSEWTAPLASETMAQSRGSTTHTGSEVLASSGLSGLQCLVCRTEQRPLPHVHRTVFGPEKTKDKHSSHEHTRGGLLVMFPSSAQGPAGVGHSQWPLSILMTDHLFSLKGVQQTSYGLHL